MQNVPVFARLKWTCNKNSFRLQYWHWFLHWLKVMGHQVITWRFRVQSRSFVYHIANTLVFVRPSLFAFSSEVLISKQNNTITGCLSMLLLSGFVSFFILELDLCILRCSLFLLSGSCNYLDPDLFPDQALLCQTLPDLHLFTEPWILNTAKYTTSSLSSLWLWEEVSE